MTDYAALAAELRELMAKREGAFAEWRSGANPRAEAQARYYTLELKDAAINALPALLALAEGAVSPVAVRYDGDGYGYRYIDNGSGSDWLTRHKDGEPLYALPTEPKS